jgi:hypothetical protein
MTQISRPFQIALAAMVLLVAVWFVALRGHSSGTESSGSGASSGAPVATPQQASGSGAGSGSGGGSAGSSSPSSTYHGSAPGVAGLTRAIAKARGAVAQQQKSDQASSSVSTQPTQTSSAGAPNATSSASAQHSAAASPTVTSPAKAVPNSAAKTHAGTSAKTHPGTPAKTAHAKNGTPAMQLKVEHQLKQGKVVAILFWNPKGSVDAVVQRELQLAGRQAGGRLAVNVASAGQVGSFGSFTRAVQVYSTPTILMVNGKGVTSSVTGLTDAFSIAQAVKEAKRAH